MAPIEHLFVVTSLLLVVAGITLVALAIRAYAQTSRSAMIHLSIGFTLIVAATIATMISTFLESFYGAQSLLLVNNGMTASGYLFVVYSLVSYD